MKEVSTTSTRVKITTTAPTADADKIRQAIGEVGAGTIGDYRFCSFSITGKGRFIPTAHADPHIGEPNQLEVVDEEQIEVVCDRSQAKLAVAAIRRAHPYEEPLVGIVALLDESEL